MTKFVEVKTAELTGPALDWAVADAEGLVDNFEVLFRQIIPGDAWVVRGGQKYHPSTDWAQGGPLIDKYRPDLQTARGSELVAYLNNDVTDPNPLIDGRGETYLVALCRAVVAAKLGDVVRVPGELMGGAS